MYTWIKEEFKSGQFIIYGQWAAVLAIPAMVFFPVLSLSAFVFCLLTWIFAFVVLCLEFPIFTKCFRANSAGERFFLASQRPYYRGTLYLIFSIVMWCSLTQSVTLLVLPALILSFATVAFWVSVFKKEDTVRSRLTGGETATTAQPPSPQAAEAGKV